MWGSPGTFIPDCLESWTPESYTSEGSLSSSVVLADRTWSQEQLRCLRAILLEVTLLSTVIASPSFFIWVPLGNFLRLFKNSSDSQYKGFCLFLCLFLPFLPHIPYRNRLFEPVETDYLKTDLAHDDR